jgi:hypothetical protein
MRLWHHVLAENLQIKPGHARALLQIGKLPDEKSSGRNFTLRASQDDRFMAAIARARTQFDTPVAHFISDLRTLILQLRAGPEAAAPNRRLVEFRFHDFGKHGGGAYPVDRHQRPWRGHRVSISAAEIVVAEYARFRALFDSTPAFSAVPITGEVKFGPFEGYYRPKCSAHLWLPLADFLERLTHVLQARAGDPPGGAS